MTTYKEAGVDVEAGEEAVELIEDLVESTWEHALGNVVRSPGAAGAVMIDVPRFKALKPFTDSVGTKPKLAALFDRPGDHMCMGIDALAMSANDANMLGFRSIMVSDCLLKGKQIPERTYAIIQGIVQGCHEANCPLLDGEMAELPKMFADDRYYEVEVSVTGALLPGDRLIDGQSIEPGMQIFGRASHGIHSNGLSLVMRIYRVDDMLNGKYSSSILERHNDDLGCSIGEALLTPTKVYTNDIRSVCAYVYDVHGFAHITGGGITGKLPKILPQGCAAKINLDAWEFPPLFQIIAKAGNVAVDEMLRTFNCGFGMIAVTRDDLSGFNWVHLGEIVATEDTPHVWYV